MVRKVICACSAVLLCLGTAGCAAIARVTSTSTESNAESHDPSVSDDGRYVAFWSNASNLVAGDHNAKADIFVRDQAGGGVERVSTASDGKQANDGSFEPSISGNGRYVAFISFATNLVTPDTNGSADVFVKDRVTGMTERVSVPTLTFQADSDSFSPSISDDGRYVAFVSFATNLVVPDANGGLRDAYRRDRATHVTTLLSVSTGGVQASEETYEVDLSGDGRYVAFSSSAWNLVPGDDNSEVDIFRRDTATATTLRVSVSTLVAQANSWSDGPSIADDGQVVAFGSAASNLVPGDTNGVRDVFVRNLTCEGTFCLAPTTRASVTTAGAQAQGTADRPDISDDGRYVAFESSAPNMLRGDTNGVDDIFVRDRVTSRTTRVNTTLLLSQAEGGPSERASISGDGRSVAFESEATNLVDGDTNGAADVFLRAQPVPTVANVTPNAHPDNGATFSATITGSNFLAGAQVRLSDTDITATVVAVTETTLTAILTIPVGTPAGSVDVFVANPGTGPGPAFGTLGRCSGCLTVT